MAAHTINDEAAIQRQSPHPAPPLCPSVPASHNCPKTPQRGRRRCRCCRSSCGGCCANRYSPSSNYCGWWSMELRSQRTALQLDIARAAAGSAGGDTQCRARVRREYHSANKVLFSHSSNHDVYKFNDKAAYDACDFGSVTLLGDTCDSPRTYVMTAMAASTASCWQATRTPKSQPCFGCWPSEKGCGY